MEGTAAATTDMEMDLDVPVDLDGLTVGETFEEVQKVPTKVPTVSIHTECPVVEPLTSLFQFCRPKRSKHTTLWSLFSSLWMAFIWPCACR